MTHRGFSHIGLSTLDLDKTRAFYEGVLGFRPVVADTITIEEGGHLRHMYFDVGGGQLIAFVGHGSYSLELKFQIESGREGLSGGGLGRRQLDTTHDFLLTQPVMRALAAGRLLSISAVSKVASRCRCRLRRAGD